MRNVSSIGKFRAAAFVAAIACTATLNINSARAATYFGGAGIQTDPSWSVTVDDGINLLGSWLFNDNTSPIGPSSQGYNANSGKILDWLNNTAGFPDATLVTDGRVDGPTNTISVPANLFGVHFGCGGDGPCELLWLFSANTTFTVNSLAGFSNISAFENPVPVPVPAALPLFGSALAAMGIFRWLRRRRAIAANA